MSTTEYKIVDSVEKLEDALARVRAAQKKFATYTQEQVDAIFRAAALAADKQRIPLAKLAVSETGMGVVEDKVIKENDHSMDQVRYFCRTALRSELKWIV